VPISLLSQLPQWCPHHLDQNPSQCTRALGGHAFCPAKRG
jgi:hypothetical protein